MAKKQNKNCKNCNNNICQCIIDVDYESVQTNSSLYEKGGIVHEAIQISIPGNDLSNMSEILIDAVNGQELVYVPFQVNETKFKDKYFQRLILKPIRDIAKLPQIKTSIEAAVEKYGKYELIDELQSIVNKMLLPTYKEDAWGLSNTKCIADREVNKYRKNLITELTGFTSTCNNCGEQTWVDNCRIFVAIIYLLED